MEKTDTSHAALKKPLPNPPLIREGSKKDAAPSCSSPDKGRLGGVSSISEEMAWNWLKQQHPAICEWLELFAVAGRKRGDKGEFWWELRSCGYYDAFQQTKIVYVDIGSCPTFYFDEKGHYCANTAYFVPQGEQFLTGILNSRVFWYLITGKSNAIRGGFYRLFTQHMDTIPIPEATDEQKAAIATLAESCQSLAEQRYALENAFRRRIPDLCPKGRDPKLSQKLQAWWLLDFAAFRDEVKKLFKQEIPLAERNTWEAWFDKDKAVLQDLSCQLAGQEQALNREVYALFRLDAGEVALLEASI